MTDDFEKLDKFYRYSEKKEIEKFNQLGKTTKEFYEQKEMTEQLESQKQIDEEKGVTSADIMKKKLLNREQDQNVMEVKQIEGEGYSQLEFSQNSDSPDPRVGGTKIIFDTRLKDVTEKSQSSQLDTFMKIKSEEK